MKKFYTAMVAAALFAAPLAIQVQAADVSTQISVDAKALVKALFPDNSGITVVANSEKYAGGPSASGFFKDAPFSNFKEGVVLSTGDVSGNALVGPSSKGFSNSNGALGDTDLTAIVAPRTTNNAGVLEFDFIPTKDVVSFQYIFASEEYNEYVGSSYNDVFAFFLNGKNIALLPGTTTPITINGVNNGSNPAYYFDNTKGAINTALDGFVGLKKDLFATGPVKPGEVNHIKLAVADTSDSILDSAVFIRGSSFTDVPPPPPTAVPLPAGVWMGLSGFAGMGGFRAIRRFLGKTA